MAGSCGMSSLATRQSAKPIIRRKSCLNCVHATLGMLKKINLNLLTTIGLSHRVFSMRMSKQLIFHAKRSLVTRGGSAINQQLCTSSSVTPEPTMYTVELFSQAPCCEFEKWAESM